MINHPAFRHKDSDNIFKGSFGFIAPTKLLSVTDAIVSEGTSEGEGFHLALAHLVDSDEKYAKFYKMKAAQGDYIIMDNSAFELKEPYSPDKLLSLGEQIGARAIVLPDYPGREGSVTIEAAEKYIPIFKDNGFDTMFVPQSKFDDMRDYIDTYEYAAKNKHIDIIGMSILGIPNCIPTVAKAYARVVMTGILLEKGVFNTSKHHHYLGANAGIKLEAESLLKMNVVSSMDSSGPIWSAILGHEYSQNTDSFLATIKPSLSVDFGIDLKIDTDLIDRLTSNIKMTQQLFGKNYTDQYLRSYK